MKVTDNSVIFTSIILTLIYPYLPRFLPIFYVSMLYSVKATEYSVSSAGNEYSPSSQVTCIKKTELSVVKRLTVHSSCVQTHCHSSRDEIVNDTVLSGVVYNILQWIWYFVICITYIRCKWWSCDAILRIGPWHYDDIITRYDFFHSLSDEQTTSKSRLMTRLTHNDTKYLRLQLIKKSFHTIQKLGL